MLSLALSDVIVPCKVQGLTMKSPNHPSNNISLNPSNTPDIQAVIAAVDHSRRHLFKASALAAGVAGLQACGLHKLAPTAAVPAYPGFGGIGFNSIPAVTAPVEDRVRVPPGYQVEPLISWGDPILPGAPAWQEDASQDASTQAQQFGMHNDGMHYFPLLSAGKGNNAGLLCVNHEYTHEEILHGAEGMSGGAGVTLAKVRKSQAAQGVSVMEVQNRAGRWQLNPNSPYARRITANTPMRMAGPAAGHALLKAVRFEVSATGSKPVGMLDGFTALGTFANCANGYTPWGTYLTCEENWNQMFGGTPGQPVGLADPKQDAALRKSYHRYGVKPAQQAPWGQRDPRFDLSRNPLEPYLFGWVAEIDPFDPASVPVKRTAMGRFKHESAQMALSDEGDVKRLAYYMGDDESSEYIYKFVASKAYDPNNAAANRDLLDAGTLYAARFSATPAGPANTFRGQWLALVPNAPTLIDNPARPGQQYRLRDLPQFAAATDAEVQALILINTRQAADALGATMMDRPEWTALRTYANQQHLPYNAQRPLEIYCSLTNNKQRGQLPPSVNQPDGSTAAGSATPPVDHANPRPDNVYGQTIRWREADNRVTAEHFEWDLLVLGGDAQTTKTLPASHNPTNLVGPAPGSGGYYQGNIIDNSPAHPAHPASFGGNDGLWFDDHGRLWILTDQPGAASGDWNHIGANSLCCADPATREVRRFMTSPPHCEVTGITSTPDGKTLFVGIQHPGENALAANPTEFSNWPQAQFTHNSAGQALPNGPKRRPRSSVLVITRADAGIIGA